MNSRRATRVVGVGPGGCLKQHAGHNTILKGLSAMTGTANFQTGARKHEPLQKQVQKNLRRAAAVHAPGAQAIETTARSW